MFNTDVLNIARSNYTVHIDNNITIFSEYFFFIPQLVKSAEPKIQKAQCVHIFLWLLCAFFRDRLPELQV